MNVTDFDYHFLMLNSTIWISLGYMVENLFMLIIGTICIITAIIRLVQLDRKVI